MDKRSKERVIPLEIYTDGSLKKMGQHSNFGGWAFCAVRNGEIIHFESGNEPMTTNQRMEMVAVIEALRYAQSIRKNSEKVIIYSDSAYIVNCYLQEWYIKWEQNGWLNAAKKTVSNKELWMQIVPFFDHFWYEFRKIEGHAGHYYNEIVDGLAQKEAEQLKISWRG